MTEAFDLMEEANWDIEGGENYAAPADAYAYDHRAELVALRDAMTATKLKGA